MNIDTFITKNKHITTFNKILSYIPIEALIDILWELNKEPSTDIKLFIEEGLKRIKQTIENDLHCVHWNYDCSNIVDLLPDENLPKAKWLIENIFDGNTNEYTNTIKLIQNLSNK